MSASERNNLFSGERAHLTSSDLNNILEVNKKSIEVHLAVVKQNENIIENIGDLSVKTQALSSVINDIDKNLFKLIFVLSSISVGSVISLIIAMIKIFLTH